MWRSQPRQRMLELLSQAPDLTRDQIYPAEAFSIREKMSEAEQALDRNSDHASKGVWLPLAGTSLKVFPRRLGALGTEDRDEDKYSDNCE